MNIALVPARILPVLGLLLLTACSKHTSATPKSSPPLPAASVTTQAVGHAQHQAVEEAVGTVRPRLSAVVEPKLSGRIEQLPVHTGQRVKTGDLLAQLDAREVQARLDQAIAVRDQANSDLKRFSALLQQEAVTRAEFDAVQARQRIADAAVVEAETMLAHTRVLAPFDAVITRKHADLGDLASPGRPLLELEDPSRLRLEAAVPEALIEHVRQGSTLRVRIPTLERDLQGTVAEIAPAADPGSRTFLAKIDLPADPALRTGQFGRVAIPVGAFSSFRIPYSAVLQRGQLELAFVVQDQKAQLRIIKTGKVIGSEVEVVSGVESNEVVVTSGADTLVDGQPLQVR